MPKMGGQSHLRSLAWPQSLAGPPRAKRAKQPAQRSREDNNDRASPTRPRKLDVPVRPRVYSDRKPKNLLERLASGSSWSWCPPAARNAPDDLQPRRLGLPREDHAISDPHVYTNACRISDRARTRAHRMRRRPSRSPRPKISRIARCPHQMRTLQKLQRRRAFYRSTTFLSCSTSTEPEPTRSEGIARPLPVYVLLRLLVVAEGAHSDGVTPPSARRRLRDSYRALAGKDKLHVLAPREFHDEPNLF